MDELRGNLGMTASEFEAHLRVKLAAAVDHAEQMNAINTELTERAIDAETRLVEVGKILEKLRDTLTEAQRAQRQFPAEADPS